MNLDNKILIAT